MDRNYKIIFEALLSVLIIVELLVLVLITIGLLVGIKNDSIFSFGIFEFIISFLILFDLVFFRVIKGYDNGGSFVRDNWAYIIASIPLFFICFDVFQLYDFKLIIGLIGLIRIYALLKVLRITSQEVRKYPQKTKLDYATFILLLVIIFGSYLFFIVENGVNPNVHTYDSAIWFSMVSMTTVGYGDIVPVTFIGHLIGVVLILTGMAYVSLVTATLAYSFIDIFRKESRKAASKLEDTVETLKNHLASNDEKLDEILRRMDEINKKDDEKR